MDVVKNLRKVVNVKQYELAASLGIEQSNYCNIENGKLIPNNIADIQKRAIDYLLPLLELKIKLIEVDLKALCIIRDLAKENL